MRTTVGMDVSKGWLDVAVWPAGTTFQVATTPAGLDELVERLVPVAPDLIACESTGGYEQAAVARLQLAGLPVYVADGARVRSYAKGQGRRAKTDRLDAMILARFASEPEQQPPRDGATAALRELVDRRSELQRMVVAERARRTHATGYVADDLDAHLAWLADRLKAVDRAIQDAVRADATLQAKARRLMTVPGVSWGVSATVLALLPELGTLDRRHVASLVGVAPQTQQSGKQRAHAFISGGRARIRHTLYPATMAASCRRNVNPVLRQHYQRLRAAGKPAKVALIACARHLLTWLNAMLRDDLDWPQMQVAQIP